MKKSCTCTLSTLLAGQHGWSLSKAAGRRLFSPFRSTSCSPTMLHLLCPLQAGHARPVQADDAAPARDNRVPVDQDQQHD